MPANVNAEDMQALLQTNIPGMGVINIERTGDCTGRKWSVTWLTVPGELPLIEVSDLTLIFVKLSYLCCHSVDYCQNLWNFKISNF